MAVLTNDMKTLTISIEGPMLHITRGVARVTAQKEPLFGKKLLMMLTVLQFLSMFIFMLVKEPVCCIWQRA